MSPPIYKASFRGLGTTVEVAVTEEAVLGEATAIVERHVLAIDDAASRFRPDSELSRLNNANGDKVEVSWLFMTAMESAINAAQFSAGMVDPTVGTALEMCGYDRDFDQVVRDGAPITARFIEVPGWRSIRIDREHRTIQLAPGVRVDLGATAKALCADQAAQAVAAHIASPVLVNLGGDVSTAGPGPVGGWTVGLADRHDAPSERTDTQVAIQSGALATSGTTARRWSRGGEVFHHLIDPKTGTSASTMWRTATVTADSCVLANTASTSAMILDRDAPEWLASKGFHARLVRDVDGCVIRVGDWPADTTPLRPLAVSAR